MFSPVFVSKILKKLWIDFHLQNSYIFTDCYRVDYISEVIGTYSDCSFIISFRIFSCSLSVVGRRHAVSQLRCCEQRRKPMKNWEI